jgi:hypothetical protein
MVPPGREVPGGSVTDVVADPGDADRRIASTECPRKHTRGRDGAEVREVCAGAGTTDEHAGTGHATVSDTPPGGTCRARGPRASTARDARSTGPRRGDHRPLHPKRAISLPCTSCLLVFAGSIPP